VTLVVRDPARQDIVSQVEWYTEQGVPDVARRFRDATLSAIKDLQAMPAAGFPRSVANPRLAGLRRWPIRGFPEVWIYYLAKADELIILRVLHDKRDTDRVLSTSRG